MRDILLDCHFLPATHTFVVLMFSVKAAESDLWLTVLYANCVITLARSSFRLIQLVQFCHHV